MDKITPKNRKEKNYGKGSELIRFNSISIVLTCASIMVELYLTWKYFGKDPYANYSLLLLFLGIIGIFGAYWLNPVKLFDLKDYYLKDKVEGLKFLSLILITMVLVGSCMAFLNVTFRLALSTTDLYLYFLASAIIEELFFRMFLIGFFETKTKLKGVGIIVSAFIFAIFHFDAYGHSLEMMLAMFLGGIVFGIIYLLSKDITITMVAHLFINIIAVGSLIMVA